MCTYIVLQIYCEDVVVIHCTWAVLFTNYNVILIVIGQERETEAIKMMSIKGGLLDHSRAWLALSQKSSIFAEAQKVL